MHFCVSAARVSFAGRTPAHFETSGARSPKKIGTNWFMPAFVKSSPGESGNRDDDGTIVWPCLAKKSRNDWRISAEVIFERQRIEDRGRARDWQEVVHGRAGTDADGSHH